MFLTKPILLEIPPQVRRRGWYSMKEEHLCLTTYGVHPNIYRLLPRERIPAHIHRRIYDKESGFKT